MDRVREYIVGNGMAPWWCRRLLMHYQKPNGEIGIEFHGYSKDYDLNAGDKLIRHNGKIIIRRKGAAQ